MVAEAVELLFKVRTLKCRIMNVKGKSRNNYAISRSSFKRGKGKSSSWKKSTCDNSKWSEYSHFLREPDKERIYAVKNV